MFHFIRGIYFWTTSILATGVFCIMGMFIYFFHKMIGSEDPTKAVHRNSTRWGKSVFRIMIGWKISVTGQENLPKDGEACVFVCNHQSNVDILVLYFLERQFRWLSKIEVFKLPFIGKNMSWSGYIPVERGNRRSHAQAMTESENRIRAGIPMLFFPEGTRSEDGKLKDFKLGAFLLSTKCDVPVVPICISGAHKMLRKGSFLPFSATVKLTILPPEKAQDREEADLFAKRVRAKMALAISS